MEIWPPGDGVRALDSGARDHVVKWCPVGRLIWQKSPVEVQHAQKPAELTGGLGRLAALKMGYLFFLRLGTFGRHLVTEEGDLGCSED
jgi:hypothetical protein